MNERFWQFPVRCCRSEIVRSYFFQKLSSSQMNGPFVIMVSWRPYYGVLIMSQGFLLTWDQMNVDVRLPLLIIFIHKNKILKWIANNSNSTFCNMILWERTLDDDRKIQRIFSGHELSFAILSLIYRTGCLSWYTDHMP